MREESEYVGEDGAFERCEYRQREMEDSVLYLACEDCGGSGVDVGSLYEPEACRGCLGSGTEIDADIERKPVTSELMLPDCESGASLGLGGGR